MGSLRYNPALDGLRALAVLAVIGYHCDWWIFSRGYLGVDVFFVLSGFLITLLLMREHEGDGIRLGAFYLRRARRLYPALLALCAGVVLIGATSWGGAAVALLYLSDYISPPGALGHTWSLAVEEQFYLLWPLLLPFVARLKRTHALALLGVVYVAATLWSLANPDAQFRLDTRFSGLVFGSMLALIPRDSMMPRGLVIVSMAMLALGFPANRIFVEGATGALILLSYATTLPWVTRSTLVYVGRISYGLYLFHAPVAFWLNDGVIGGRERMAATLLASLGLAALSYHTIEAYFRKPRAPANSERMKPAALATQ